MGWLPSLQEKGASIHSQGGQDGFLKEILSHVGAGTRTCIEFGYNSTGSNTACLAEQGWTRILFDKDNENLSIGLHRETLTPSNISEVFYRHGVPQEPGYLSIDVDSVDLWLLKALLDDGLRPRIVSSEYNCNFPLEVSATVLPSARWKGGDAVYGASLLALWRVAIAHGYVLVCVAPRMDLFFVRADLLGGEEPLPLEAFRQFTGIRFHHVPLRRRDRLFVEYPSLEPLENLPWRPCAEAGKAV